VAVTLGATGNGVGATDVIVAVGVEGGALGALGAALGSLGGACSSP